MAQSKSELCTIFLLDEDEGVEGAVKTSFFHATTAARLRAVLALEPSKAQTN